MRLGQAGYRDFKCAEGLHITGMTLSENQYAYFRQSILVNNLQVQLSVNSCDYRKLCSQKFEQIISLGMLEHVGQHNLTRYMQAMTSIWREMVCVIHSIGPWPAMQPPRQINIFFQAYLPNLWQMLQAIEKNKKLQIL